MLLVPTSLCRILKEWSGAVHTRALPEVGVLLEAKDTP